MKPNCLTRALDQWNENRDIFILYYNSNHVIALEVDFSIKPSKYIDAGGNHITWEYLPLEAFGTLYFINSFQLSKKYLKLLGEYFNSVNPNVDIRMKFYRYEAVEYAEHDYDGELCSPIFPNPKVELKDFHLIKETTKGYWIGYLNTYGIRLGSWQKWVSKTSKKRFAYPTKKEALVNYIKRTEKRLKILERQIDFCKISLDRANSLSKLIQ